MAWRLNGPVTSSLMWHMDACSNNPPKSTGHLSPGGRVGPLTFAVQSFQQPSTLLVVNLRRISWVLLSSRQFATRMGGFYDEVTASNGVYKFYSDGEWKETTSSRTVKILNPSTNEPVYQVQGPPRSDTRSRRRRRVLSPP